MFTVIGCLMSRFLERNTCDVTEHCYGANIKRLNSLSCKRKTIDFSEKAAKIIRRELTNFNNHYIRRCFNEEEFV